MNRSSSLAKIRWVARLLRWIALAGMGLLAVIVLHTLANGASEHWFGGSVLVRLEYSGAAAADPALARWLDLLQDAALFYALYRLAQMMRLCERGEFLAPRIAGHLQGFSAAIVAYELLDLTLPLQIAAVHALSGRQGKIDLMITGGQIGLLVLALLFLALAWVLQEAARVAEDNASIV
jgi:predicted tellurium resistance membrane protein TerC